jgi:hypothetical protein
VVLDHNGRIALEAVEGEGASFQIDLPKVPLPENSMSDSDRADSDKSLPILRRAAV